MGFYVSDWYLARIISMLGQIGTISGVELGRVMAEKLRRGDPGGHFGRALSHFPFPQHAEKVWKAFYVKDGIGKGRATPFWSVMPSDLLISLTVCANFACVWLAKEGHDNPVGINYLDKIWPHIHAIFGVMLAHVDFITMGAGFPRQIPGIIKAFIEGRTASYRIPVIGKNIRSYEMSFDPKSFFGQKLPEMQIPGFYPIIASNLAVNFLLNKLPKGSIDGWVIEDKTAGGHNAPPRDPVYNEAGEMLPVYGPEDVVDLEEIGDTELPFWFGGSCASPEKLKWTQSVGAVGPQVGSLFAFCEESGIRPDIKRTVLRLGFEGKLHVGADMRISPTGFPFQVLELPGSISDDSVYKNRKRACRHCALAQLYEKPNGEIGSRCSAEPEESFVRKGGNIKETIGRKCVCCGLNSTVGLNDRNAFYVEPHLVTAGSDLSFLQNRKLLPTAESSYTAKDAIEFLLSKSE